MSVLLADDEKAIRVTLSDAREEAGHSVVVAEDGIAAKNAIEERGFDVVLTDLKMPGMPGMEVVRLVKTRAPDTEVIVMTGYGTVESAVDAMKAGAYEYLLKPFPNETVVLMLRRIQEQRRVLAGNRSLKDQPGRATQAQGSMRTPRRLGRAGQSIRLRA